MAHVMKHTKVAAGHMTHHYDRTANNISNDKIDPTRTELNYNLAPKREISQMDFINKRCSEVKCLNRKDINVMCSWTVTEPQRITKNERKNFFEETYKFLSERYGEKNVISAYVHMDETTPHMHFSFVPVVQEKSEKIIELAQKTVAKNLGKMEQDIKTTEIKCDIMVKNALEKVKSIQCDINALENEKKALQDELEGLQRQIKGTELKVEEIIRIKPYKTLTGSIKGVTVENIENLKKTALIAIQALKDFKALSHENSKLKSQIPSITEKMKYSKENVRLTEIEKAFNKLPENVQKELMLNKPQSKGLSHER